MSKENVATIATTYIQDDDGRENENEKRKQPLTNIPEKKYRKYDISEISQQKI